MILNLISSLRRSDGLNLNDSVLEFELLELLGGQGDDGDDRGGFRDGFGLDLDDLLDDPLGGLDVGLLGDHHVQVGVLVFPGDFPFDDDDILDGGLGFQESVGPDKGSQSAENEESRELHLIINMGRA